jgi:excisionase family DNA binding protein
MTARHPATNPAPSATPQPGQGSLPETQDPQPTSLAPRLAYSVDEAAQLTGLSRDLLYDQMRQGHLGYLKIGRRRLITRQHLEQFLGLIPRQPTPADAADASIKAANRGR